MKKRLAIVTTHPIQYNAPFFRKLNGSVGFDIKVFYTWGEACLNNKYDPDFGKNIQWDIPLLDGYDYEFVVNTAKNPGSSSFWGIQNPGLQQKLKEWGATDVLIYGWSFYSHLLLILLNRGNFRLHFRGDSNDLDERSELKSILRRIWLKWVYRRINYFYAVGTHNKNHYLNLGIEENRIYWAPHSIDNERFIENKFLCLNGELRTKIGKRENYKFTILFVGKFEKKKNPELVVWLAGRFPAIRFIMVGDGLLFNEIQKEIADKELSNIFLLGFVNQSQMPAVYKEADILLLPSIGPGETWGLAMNEAMASGCAIIASDKCGGAIDLIECGLYGNGLIFKLENVNILLNFVNQILLEKGYIIKLKEKSTSKIIKFNYNNIVDLLIKNIDN